MSDFTWIDRAWVHKSRQTWVVEYPETDERKGFFQAYRAVKAVPSNRMPWSIDNRRLGHELRGFKTLEEAMQAAREGAQ